MHVHTTLSGCVDCLMYIANGDVPDERPNIAKEIEAQWGELVHGLCPSGNDLDGFSYDACECCGSRLGGDRHELAILQP